jgi:hypothetical protein
MTNIFSLYLLSTNFTHLWYPIKDETFTNELEEMLEDSEKLEKDADLYADSLGFNHMMCEMKHPHFNHLLPTHVVD